VVSRLRYTTLRDVIFYVGELVREGIENDWPYIFTDVEFEPMIEARFAAIKQGFDRIRGRDPRR
jgi:hypothetical protein